MKYLVAPFAFAALALATVAVPAAPFQSKNIAAGAKWVIHVDVDAIRDSKIVKKAFATCPILKNSGMVFDMIRDKAGIDLRKDLHGITLYGPDSDKKHAVAIVFATVNKTLLTEKAQKAADHKLTRRGGIEIHSWTAKHFGKTEPGAGAFYKDDAIVFAADVDGVSKAIDVLSGKSPGNSNPLLTGTVRGATVIVRAAEIPDNVNCPILKQVKSFRVALGENDGKSFARKRIIMKTPEAAQQVKAVNDGFKALMSLYFADDADMMKIVEGSTSTLRGSTVTVRWEAPVEDVWNAMEKLAKKVEAHIKKMKEMHEGQKNEEKHESEKKSEKHESESEE
jgi:hypothetical protein